MQLTGFFAIGEGFAIDERVCNWRGLCMGERVCNFRASLQLANVYATVDVYAIDGSCMQWRVFIYAMACCMARVY